MRSPSPVEIAAILGTGTAYATALAVLWQRDRDSFEGALVVLAILGIAVPFTLLALTRRRPAPALPSAQAVCMPLLGYTGLFALLVLGFGFSWIRAVLTDLRAQELALLGLKLLTMFAIPLWLLSRVASPRFWLGSVGWLPGFGMPLLVTSAALFGFQLFFGRGLSNLEALAPVPST